MRKTTLVAASFAALTLARCGSDSSGPQIVYEGRTSDEAYLVITDAESRVMLDAAKGPSVTVPTEGQAYQPSEAPPPFRWTSPLSASLTPRRHVNPRARVTTLADLLLPGERSAAAHLPPITGPVYVLRFTVPGEGTVTVVTSELSYTPADNVWGTIKQASGRIRLEITGAYLRNNVIEEGPFRQPTPRSFGIAATFW